MTRFFCDFCDTYLTHDSVRVAWGCAGKLLQQQFVTSAENILLVLSRFKFVNSTTQGTSTK